MRCGSAAIDIVPNSIVPNSAVIAVAAINKTKLCFTVIARPVIVRPVIVRSSSSFLLATIVSGQLLRASYYGPVNTSRLLQAKGPGRRAKNMPLTLYRTVPSDCGKFMKKLTTPHSRRHFKTPRRVMQRILGGGSNRPWTHPPRRARRRSTTGSMRRLISLIPCMFGCSPSSRFNAGSSATPSRKKG